MNKWAELLIGLVLVIVPIVVAINHQYIGIATLQTLVGGIVLVLVLIGILFLMLGISDMKS